MRTKLYGRRSSAFLASATLLLGMLPCTWAYAASTGFIQPQPGNGATINWAVSAPGPEGTNEGSYVNDGIGCIPNDTSWWVSSIPSRSSAIITIPAAIVDGSTIVSVDVQVCQGRSELGADGATFQTYVRANTTNIDSGVNITAATPFSAPVPATQTIPVNIVKSGATTLEVGVFKTNRAATANDPALGQRIYTIAARINYTLPSTGGGPTDPGPGGVATPVPVFGPLGFVLTMLGLGLIGGWQVRRRV
jgi:hypothetical protein